MVYFHRSFGEGVTGVGFTVLNQLHTLRCQL